jgi:hypothetical protein
MGTIKMLIKAVYHSWTHITSSMRIFQMPGQMCHLCYEKIKVGAHWWNQAEPISLYHRLQRTDHRLSTSHMPRPGIRASNWLSSSQMKHFIINAIFLKKIGSGTHSDPKFGRRGGGVSYIDDRKKRFRNAVPVCVLLRKNFRNGVPSQKYICL